MNANAWRSAMYEIVSWSTSSKEGGDVQISERKRRASVPSEEKNLKIGLVNLFFGEGRLAMRT
jgi:hypothetical protein